MRAVLSELMKTNLVNGLFVAVSIIAASPVYAVMNPAQTQAPTTAPQHVYPSGVNVAMDIAKDLYDSLDNKYRNKVQEPPVRVVPGNVPELAPISDANGDKSLGQLSVSVGFVNLINHIAHALAVDKVQPGYFEQYMAYLGQETADGKSVQAPEIAEDRYWTDDIINDQASYFNQMMGLTMAINLSHYYLGEYDKYAGTTEAGKPVAVNNYVTSSEWNKDLRAATENALQCAFATEGGKALFAAIDKMPHRPAWTADILPQNVDVKKMNKHLAKLEFDFFHGGLN